MGQHGPRAAAAYARISEDKTGAGLGVERQLADCRDLATRLGWPLVAVHSDNDISAYSGKPRPGYRALLADVEAGRVGAVLAWHTDRLHRSPIELEHYIGVCEAQDVVTHTVQAGLLDLSTATGRMTARITGAVARQESEHKGERVARARLQAAEQGRPQGGPRPFGYERDGVTVRDPEAVLVREGVAAVLAGASLRSVALMFNAAGSTTTMKRSPWDRTAVREMLLRPRNAGLRQHRGQEIGPAAWPALVPEEQWRAVVAILTDDRRRTVPMGARAKWLGSGLYVCDGCDRPSLRVSTSGARPHAVYRCPGVPGTTGHVTRGAAALDGYVTALIIERLSRADAAELLVPAAPEVDLIALRADATAARERLREIAEMLGEGELTRAEAQIARGRAAERLKRAESAQRAATGASPLAGLVDVPDPGAVWVGLDLGRRRAVLAALMTVRVLPVPRGAPPGFDPAAVAIIPKVS